MRTQIAFTILAILLVSCTTAVTHAPTEILISKTETPKKTDFPTRIPGPTSTTRPTSTFDQTLSVWQIWFRGFSCEELAQCGIVGPDQDLYYFSINSDGTEIKSLQIKFFAPPQLPNGAPPMPDAFAAIPQKSPDGSTLTYSAKDGDLYGLYIVDIPSGKATRLYQTKKIEDHLFWLGTACWAPNGKTIEFLVHSRRGNKNQPPEMYTIDRDGNNLQTLFSLPGLENSWFGDCSPDGKELVLSIGGNSKVAENGLYLINRSTGHLRQILSSYYASTVRAAQHEIP